MDGIAVLFPASGADLADARGDWKSEYEACRVAIFSCRSSTTRTDSLADLISR